MWQAGPRGRQRTRTASPSQSAASSTTSSVLPEVAPFSQSSPRERLKNVARPVSSVRSRASRLAQASISTSPVVGVLADAGDQALPVVAQRVEVEGRRAQRTGSPRSRQTAFTSSTENVPSWKIEAASAPSAPASSASARCSGRAGAARGDHRHGHRGRPARAAARGRSRPACRRGPSRSPAAPRRRARRPPRPRPCASRPVGVRPPSTNTSQPPLARRASMAQTTHWLPKRSARLGQELRAGAARRC